MTYQNASLLLSLPFHKPLLINSPDKELMDTISCLYGQYCVSLKDTEAFSCESHSSVSENICAALAVEITPLSNRMFSVSVLRKGSCSSETVLQVQKISRIFKFLENLSTLYPANAALGTADCINGTVTDNETVFAIHAAGVEVGGKAYLFSAATGEGKSTLIAYLTTRGFSYISDDCIYLKRKKDVSTESNALKLSHISKINVYPYQKPVHLRDGGKLALEKNLCSKGEILETQYCHYSVLPELSRHIFIPKYLSPSQLPLGKIFFFKRGEENFSSPSPLSVQLALQNLLQASTCQHSLEKNYLSFLLQLANGYCWTLIYQDMEWVFQYLKKENSF